MKDEFDKKITTDFPDMFQQIKRGEMRSTLISNIGCGDGWFNLIYDLCKEIEPMRPTVMQIKEKFGTLRFYCSFPKDYSEMGSAFIRIAEHKSAETCEECGEAGEFRVRSGWRMVSCDKCHDIYCKDHPEEVYP